MKWMLLYKTAVHILMGVLVVSLLLACGQFVNKNDYAVLPHQSLPMCPPEKALVYFLSYEPAPGEVALATFRDDAMIGALRSGGYFYHIVEPGKYDFWVDSGLIEKKRERVSLAIKPGKTYFLRYSPGGYYVVAKLELISEEVATTYLSTLDYVQMKHKTK